MTIFLEIETPYRLLQVGEIKMFHAKAVARWRGMVAAAQERLGGASSGFGFVGSPAWVVTGSLILGAIEGALSSANSKAGLKMLGEAGAFMTEIRERGIYLPISDISEVQNSQPGAWNAINDGLPFVSLDDDFLQVRTIDGTELMLRWSLVVSVRVTSG